MDKKLVPVGPTAVKETPPHPAWWARPVDQGHWVVRGQHTATYGGKGFKQRARVNGKRPVGVCVCMWAFDPGGGVIPTQSGRFSSFSSISQKCRSVRGGGVRRPYFWYAERTFLAIQGLQGFSAAKLCACGMLQNFPWALLQLHPKVKSGHFVQFDVLNPKMKVVRL